MKSKMFASFAILALILGQFFSFPAYAEEYSISDNGNGSTNEISAKHEVNKTVEQTNNAEVKNEVKLEAQTGENKTSDNSGKSKIETGDASTETTIANSGNTNQAQVGCCPTSGGLAQITGNGADSNNQINSGQKSTVGVLQNNGAKITNNITVSANTGDNEASDNNGDTSIRTGNVNTQIGFENQGNTSYASVGGGLKGLNLKIAGNGVGSENNIEENYDQTQQFFVNNYLELNNNINNQANTGGNIAKRNLGLVKVSTGNVYLDIILSNKFNNSVIIAECGCKVSPSPTPTPSGSPSPSTPPSGGGGSSGSSSGGSGGSSDSGSSSGGSSSSSGQVLGASLPSTGGFSLIQATMFALGLLGSGIILRLDFKNKKTDVKKNKKQVSYDIIYGFEKIIGKYINWKFPTPVPRYLFTNFKNLPAL